MTPAVATVQVSGSAPAPALSGNAALASGSAASDAARQAWEQVRARLRAEYGDAAFRSWLKPLGLAGVHNGQVMITVPTRFMRDWVVSHYADAIVRLWQQEDPAIRSLDIFVRSSAYQPGLTPGGPVSGTVATGAAEHGAGDAAQTPRTSAYTAPQQYGSSGPSGHAGPTHGSNTHGNHNGHTQGNATPGAFAPYALEGGAKADAAISASLDPRYTFEHFVVGKPNELAYAAARRVADAPAVIPGCNPLFLYGGVGLGKTHLMHAIAWHIRQNHPQRRVIYLSAEKFMYEFIRALRYKDTMAFKEQFRSVDVLMIDDVQFISGKDSTQEEFFHTFNALVDQNRQIVLSGDRSPSDLDGIEERVRSRLGWGLVADIHTTTYELRLGILQSKVEQMPGAAIPDKVLEFLALRITSNIRELEGALNRVVAHATLVGRPITLEGTQEVLHDLLRANDRRVTVEDIQKRVAAHYNIKVADMHSARRSRTIARPRQVAMYLAKKFTAKSLPEIGRKFGGKDHTTVMHAVKRVEELMASQHDLAEDVALLTRALQA